MSICVGTNGIVAALATVLVGEVSPESIKTYVSLHADPWDNNAQINFEEPMAAFGIEHDINTNVRLFVEHLSSPMQCNDAPGVNHAGVKFLAPINDFTIYSGVSINNPDFDSNDRFDGPLASVGVEYGNDLKLYTEYLSAIKNFDDGRFSVGLKVFFK